jgi:hypothetical protein
MTLKPSKNLKRFSELERREMEKFEENEVF